MVTDLQHFLDLPVDAPGPTRRLADQLGNLVRAATAGDAGSAWESALPCRRRPGNSRCPGRMVVHRAPDAALPIRWQCSVCNDEGVISNWSDSPFDLRPRRLTSADPVHEIVIPTAVATALRELQLLDTDCERLVFRIRPHDDGAILPTTEDGLEELIGYVAAEANHEPNQRRRRRLDAAFDILNDAAHARGW
jgi:hypothetical protein